LCAKCCDRAFAARAAAVPASRRAPLPGKAAALFVLEAQARVGVLGAGRHRFIARARPLQPVGQVAHTEVVRQVLVGDEVQDRLSKSRIYAGAAIPEYWIVNLRDDCIEIFRSPDAAKRVYLERGAALRGEIIHLVAFPDASIVVGAVLPPRRSPG
jgi:hypothetical protein